MRVDAVVYLSEALLKQFTEDRAIKQLADAATLPGLAGPVLGMPDLHLGFGLPIGGVMVTDPDQGGVVSAGATGYDINCGVRLLRAELRHSELGEAVLRRLMKAILRRIPSGVGKSSRHEDLHKGVMERVCHGGVPELVSMGYGLPDDVSFIEEEGCLKGARLDAVSKDARSRADQLGTIGGGNHFIEFQVIEEVYDQQLAAAFGLKGGYVTVMIHSGSRGFGHQICTDYSKIMLEASSRYGIQLPSKGLAAAPIDSAEGQGYLAGMACAVNYAFANRQLMTHDIREAFSEVLGGGKGENVRVVYDVAHNIAKFEEHFGRRVLVHRKGATRALPAGHPGNPPVFRQTGHPALVPGSMGTGSYVLVGTDATRETFFSVNHGAGRTMSRKGAKKGFTREDFEASVGGVIYSGSYKHLLDEIPDAYKDIDEVVDTLAQIDLTRKVVRLRPLAVIKGEGADR